MCMFDKVLKEVIIHITKKVNKRYDELRNILDNFTFFFRFGVK